MNFYDEMYGLEAAKRVSLPHYQAYERWSSAYSSEAMAHKRAQADAAFRQVGITFAVYGDDAGTERLIPFDLIPRIIPSHEWATLQKGLIQRVQALNMFIHDIYHDQHIVKAGIVPAEQIYMNAQYRPHMQGVDLSSRLTAQVETVEGAPTLG